MVEAATKHYRPKTADYSYVSRSMIAMSIMVVAYVGSTVVVLQ